MTCSRLEVLSENEVRQIHTATLDILTGCGVKVLNRRMLDFLDTKGLTVDRKAQTVCFTPASVEDALAATPAQFEVHDRDGKLAYVLGDRVPKIAAGHNAVYWVDTDTGATRPSRVTDIELFARICEELESIDMIGVPVMPQDVPNPKATLLYGVRAVIENSIKPVFFSTDNAAVNRSVIDLLKAGFAGRLGKQAYGIAQLSPTSPLYWEEGVIDAMVDTVQSEVPLAILPEPNAGVSAPYTLAGLLTMNNAECLSGIAMCQLLKPGSRLLYANSWTTTDMRTGAALVGSVETVVCRIAGAQFARVYGVPCHTTAPNSDNHAHDEQNAWEKTLSMFCSVVSGHDLIVNCGMFASGLTCSHEQLILDERISALSHRIAAGIEVSPDTIAVDLIKQIGPMGETYLTAEHTLRWLRSGEYLPRQISVCGPRATWERDGAKDIYQLARDRVEAYRRQHPQPLDSDRTKHLDEILARFH